MNPYQRAFTSIVRHKLNTTLLFFLTFVLGALMAMMLLTHHASIQAQQNVIHMQPQAIIGRDQAAIIEHRFVSDDTFLPWLPIVPPLTVELIHEIASLPYVESVEYFLERQLYAADLERYRPSIELYQIAVLSTDMGLVYDVRGVQVPQFAEIEQNVIEIISGRTFTAEELEQSLPVALVSEGFARQNQLSVGSVISLRSVVINPNQIYDFRGFNKGNTLGYLFYDVEIIGLFHVALDDSPHACDFLNRSHLWVMEQLHNRIVVPNGFVAQVDEEMRELAENTSFYIKLSELQEVVFGELSPDEKASMYFGLYAVTHYYFTRLGTFFTLSHPHDVIPFIESVEPLLPEYYTIHFADHHSQAIIHALESLERISAILLSIVIGAILLTFGLLITLYMRNRKQEIGVYLAIGVRKKHIGLQMICEMIMVSTPALILSLLVGNVTGNSIAENILINDLLRIEEISRPDYFHNLFFLFGLGGDQVAVNTLLQSYDHALTIGLALLFMGVAIVTILVSAILPLIYALRQHPKKIMM